MPDTPSNRTLNAISKAQELALYTIKICKNQKVFVPEYASVTRVITKTAMDIYAMAFDANNIVVKQGVTDYEKNVEDRLQEQVLCIRKCSDLLGYINIAKPLFHLRKGKYEYWTALTIDARTYLHKWHEGDAKRLKLK